MAKGTVDKKPIVLDFSAETGKIEAQFSALSTRFGTLTKNIQASISVASYEIYSKIDQTNKKLEYTNDKLLMISESTQGLKKTINDGFGSLNNILTSNHAKMDAIVKQLVAMHQQTMQVVNANRALAASGKASEESLGGAFGKLKLMNMAWNSIRAAAKEYYHELVNLEKTSAQIATLTGEDLEMISHKTIALSSKTGVAVGDISKALLNAANNGETLSNSFEAINAGITLSTKNGLDQGTMIRAIDDITKGFNITVSKTQAILYGNNLTGGKSINLFTSLAKDAREGGISAEMLGAMLGSLRNEASITEKSIRGGFKELSDGLQRAGKDGQDAFFNIILPQWNQMDVAQKRIAQNNLGIKLDGEIIDVLGKKWGTIVDKLDSVNRNEEQIVSRAASHPDTLALQMNAAWNAGLDLLRETGIMMDKMISNSNFLRMAILGIANLTRSMHNINLNNEIGAADEKLAKIQAERELLENVRDSSQFKRSANAQEKEANRQGILKQVYLEQQAQEQLNNLMGIANNTLNGTVDSQSHLTQGAHVYKAVTSDILDTLKGVKKVNSDNAEEQRKAISEIQKQFAIDKVMLGKKQAYANEVAALKERLVLIVKEQQTSMAIGKTEDYRKNLAKERVATETALWKAQDQFNKASDAEVKKSVSSSRQSANELRKEKIDEFEAEKKRIIELHKNGELNTFETIHGLTMTKGILNGVLDVKTKMQDIDNLNRDLGRQELQERQKLNAEFDIEDKTRSNMYAHLILEEQRYQLIAKSKGKGLSKEQEINFEKQNLEILTREAIGGRNLQVIMERVNHAVAEKHRLMLGADKARRQILAQELKEVEHTGQVEMAAATKANRFEEQLHTHEKNNYLKNHDIMKASADAFASHTTGAMNTLFDSLIMNTGTLSHIWGDFFNGLMADIAKAMAKMALLATVKSSLGIAEGTFGGFLFSALGGAHGTSLTGVPGYAMGSPIKGVDTVPAMLSPGEIVLDNNASDMFRSLMKHGMTPNMGDMMRSMKGSSMSQPVVVHVHSSPSLLGNRHEIMKLDTALNNPVVRSYTDRRKI